MALVILNFKAYEQAIGDNSLNLAKIAKEVADSTGMHIIVAVQTADIARTAPIIETMAQHIDPIDLGAGTGTQTAEAAKQAGASGSLLNHSEQNIPISQAEKSIKKLLSLGMKSCACASTPDKGQELAKFRPDYVAIEPPELIGSGVSVSSAKPEIVTESIENIRQVNKDVEILCGAGISTGDDVKKALDLGVTGVLLASAFTKAENPKEVLEDICRGF